MRARFFTPLIVGGAATALHVNLYDGTLASAPVAVGALFAVVVALTVWYAVRAGSTRDLLASAALFALAFIPSPVAVAVILVGAAAWAVAVYTAA